ncbi:MAG: tetratricopeptide repeat protein, partial [Fibrobacteria bacterium]
MAMKRILSICAVCLTFSASAAAAAAKVKAAMAPAKPALAESKVFEICKQGRAQYTSGELLKAIKSLEKCVEHEPRNREAWVSLANASLEAGHFQTSANAFSKAETIRPGDEEFLRGYLSALDGAGLVSQRISVLRSMVALKHADAKSATELLAAVEAAGPEKYPEEYLMALQVIAKKPGADYNQVEKLAAFYFKRGQLEKAEAEYRGLLVRNPESGDTWAGLGATLASTDPQAASECYRKAAFFSNQADTRAAFTREQKRLASPVKREGKPAPAEAKKKEAMVAATAKPSVVKPVAAPSIKPRPFNAKAYQDSIYKAELAKLQADDAKVKEDRRKQEELARKAVESGTQRSAKVEKAKQDSLARVAEQKAKDDRVKQEALAKAEKSRQDSIARVADLKAKEEKAKQESLAKAERIRQDSLVRVAGQKSKDEKAKQDSLARVAEQKAKDDRVKQEALAKAEKSRQDSIARVADLKAKEEKAKQESLAKAERIRQDSLARVAEQKAKTDREKQEALAKAEKARQDSVARVDEQKAKEEKKRLVREKLSRDRRERNDRAVAFYREGRIDSSLILFKTVLADSPSADAYYFAGRANLAKGDFSRALDLFAKGPQDKPDLDGLKGRSLMGLGKHKEALAALESQYAKSKDDSLLEDLAALKRKTGDEAGSIGYLEMVVERHPGMEKVQEQLAAYYRAKGDKARAAEKYLGVLAVNPNHAEAVYWLGMEAAGSGNAERAVPFLEKAVTLQPSRADAWKALAMADASLGRKDAAWEAFRKAIALLPADLDLARGRLALARESHPADLAKAYEDVLRLSPSDADAALGLAKMRFDEGDWRAAETNFR